MTNLILACAGILLGFAHVIDKKLALEKYHPATYTALIQTLAGIIALPLLFYRFKIPTHPAYWLLTFISITAFGTGFFFGIKAYKSIDVSAVGLISRFKIVFAAFIGIVFLTESYSTNSYFGLLFILIGSLIVIYQPGKHKIDQGVFFAIIMALLYSLAAIFDKVLLNHFSPYTYIFVNNITIGLVFSSIPQARREATQLFKTKTRLVIATAAMGVLSWLLFLVVLQQGSVSTAYPIYDSMALIATVGVGIVWLKETKRLPQKIIGTASVILGIFLLG